MPHSPTAEAPNEQEKGTFEQDQARVAALAASLTWVRPSTQDTDRPPDIESIEEATGAPEQAAPIGAVRCAPNYYNTAQADGGGAHRRTRRGDGRLRRTRGRAPAAAGFGNRGESSPPSPVEMGETAMRTLALPDVAALRPHLLPELPVFSILEEPPITALAGRVDALAVAEGGHADAVFDWKSDVSPSEEVVSIHAAQLQD